MFDGFYENNVFVQEQDNRKKYVVKEGKVFEIYYDGTLSKPLNKS